jgi:hypothetical protein
MKIFWYGYKPWPPTKKYLQMQAAEMKLLCPAGSYTLMEFRRMGYQKATKHIYSEKSK